MDTATTVVYNGKPITIYPKVRIKGLLGSDSATVSTRFSSATYTETSTVPTDVDTYTVRGTVPVFSSGTANNYVAIVYETSTATVTKAKQDPLNVARYGAYLGQSFYISVLGGSGDGAVSETITSGSTAPNCSLSNHYLSTSATELSYCVITVSKGSSKNYLSESATVQIYFLPVYNAQPAPPAGSGPTISISGSTALTKDDSATVRAPSISGLSTYSAAVGDSVIITGEAFGNQATTVVKLGRSTDTISYVVNSPTQITITILSGARTAAVVVVTANGITFSDTPLTIVP
jgi:hypothetical protein